MTELNRKYFNMSGDIKKLITVIYTYHGWAYGVYSWSMENPVERMYGERT